MKQFEFILVQFFVCLFSKIYADACYVFESLDKVSWMTTKWNAMHICASQDTYSYDMHDCDEFIIIYKER